MSNPRSSTPLPGHTGLWPALARFARVLAGMALVAGVLLLGLLLAAGLLLRAAWVSVRGRTSAPAPGRAQRAMGEVVDIEAREVPARPPAP